MSYVALIPTKDRPDLLERALTSFLAAATSADFPIAAVIVCDDSSELTVNAEVIASARATTKELIVDHLASDGTGGSGPGRTRSRGLRHVIQRRIPHEGVIMFDDDISFADCDYQGNRLKSDGEALLRDVVRHDVPTIVGCGYVGRQDLALLDHIVLLASRGPNASTQASATRADVQHEAPHGISGAFLAIPANAAHLPEFLPWYNEDYFWLRRVERDGWPIVQSNFSLAHAPHDGLSISVQRLHFEQYGEALWCASIDLKADAPREELLSRMRQSICDRVEELVSARSALAQTGNPEAQRTLSPILEAVEKELRETLTHLVRGESVKIAEDLAVVAAYCGT